MVKFCPLYFSVPRNAGRFHASRVSNEGIMIEPENSPESDNAQATEVSQEEVRDVHAGSVQMNQAAAETISASDIQMEMSAAAAVKATNVSAHQSALAAVEATQVLSEQSFTGMVQADKASVSGYTGAVAAGTAEIHYGLTGVVIGNDVHVSDQSRTVLLISKNVQGNVTILMDTRSALIAGLLGGLFGGIMLLLGRMLFKRD